MARPRPPIGGDSDGIAGSPGSGIRHLDSQRPVRGWIPSSQLTAVVGVPDDVGHRFARREPHVLGDGIDWVAQPRVHRPAALPPGPGGRARSRNERPVRDRERADHIGGIPRSDARSRLLDLLYVGLVQILGRGLFARRGASSHLRHAGGPGSGLSIEYSGCGLVDRLRTAPRLALILSCALKRRRVRPDRSGQSWAVDGDRYGRLARSVVFASGSRTSCPTYVSGAVPEPPSSDRRCGPQSAMASSELGIALLTASWLTREVLDASEGAKQRRRRRFARWLFCCSDPWRTPTTSWSRTDRCAHRRKPPHQ
jgi:hypothetical protein